jgi:hypothetical protein
MIFSLSCSLPSTSLKNYSGKSYFTFEDPSGVYTLKRELAETNKKIQLRQQLFKGQDEGNPLEKSITISEVGKVKENKSIRPMISQFSIWFEKKKYFSQLKLNKKDRGMDLILKSPEKKWNKNKKIKFEKGIVFCWLSQIPECLRRANYLSKDKELKRRFKVIWESFPYYTEQYRNLTANVFSDAIISYDGVFRDHLKFAVQVDNQLIIYHFSKKLEFKKMFWVSQGISIIKR